MAEEPVQQSYLTATESKVDFNEYVTQLTKVAKKVIAKQSVSSTTKDYLHKIDSLLLEEVSINDQSSIYRLTLTGENFPSASSVKPILSINEQEITGHLYDSSEKIYFIFEKDEAPKNGDQLSFGFGHKNAQYTKTVLTTNLEIK